MQVVSFPTRQARAQYRHELRTLTYVTLDEGNGGIIRNLSREGFSVQAVVRLRQQQRVRLRFELRSPRVRVETSGLVSWASPSGQCGIRFMDLPDRTGQQIDEWIFSNLLDALARDAARHGSMFEASVVSIAGQAGAGDSESDGLIVSEAARPAIRLEPRSDEREETPPLHEVDLDQQAELNWLSRPLSGRTLAWMVDSLVVIAALLLFALTFLSIAHELPRWPVALGIATLAAVFVGSTYRMMFALFGGGSLGSRLAQAAANVEEKENEDGVRIR